jgi:hypothetical protein
VFFKDATYIKYEDTATPTNTKEIVVSTILEDILSK